jgi:hypothetical protein
MTSRRTLIGAAALIALTVSCTRPEVTADTQPLAPPDSFAPSTTAQPRTATTVDVDRAAISRVFPTTLEAIPGLDPIPVGDWSWGISSDNGSWLALSVGHDNRDQVELRLVDIDGWEVATTWFPSIDNPLHVTDDGTIYVISGMTPSYHLGQLVPGEMRPQVIADLPPQLLWQQLHIHDGSALIFGLTSPNLDDKGHGVIVMVDLTTGLVTEIPLPGVEIGIVAEFEIGETEPVRLFAEPAVVWDDQRSRVLIVHANQDVVTEVNPATGEVTEHRFGDEDTSATADDAFTVGRRTAVLGQSGESLYVATAIEDYRLVDQGWTDEMRSTGIESVDTETWEVVDRLEAPISAVYLSPVGHRLLATGQSYSYGPTTNESESSGFYVIDPVDLGVVAHHGGSEPNLYYGEISFNIDVPVGYVTSWDQEINIRVVDTNTGNIIHTRSHPEIQVFGEAGVLGEVTQGP